MNSVQCAIKLQEIYDNQCRDCLLEKLHDMKTIKKMIGGPELLTPFYKVLLKENKCNSFQKNN